MGVGRGVVQGSRGRGEHLVLRELDVALVVQKHNVQLQVPVDDAGLVKVVQRQADLGQTRSRRTVCSESGSRSEDKPGTEAGIGSRLHPVNVIVIRGKLSSSMV